jgi:acyl-CoA reductase-like NAD-dependent aldehyde dehydrogenase
MSVFAEEAFGSVAVIVRATDDDAMELAKRTLEPEESQ